MTVKDTVREQCSISKRIRTALVGGDHDRGAGSYAGRVLHLNGDQVLGEWAQARDGVTLRAWRGEIIIHLPETKGPPTAKPTKALG